MVSQNYSKHEKDQEIYWSNLANNQHNRVSAVHWVDEADKPISEEMFFDISNWILTKANVPITGARILEIGCGNGLMLEAIAEVSKNKGIEPLLFGTDISKAQLDKATPIFHLDVAPANKQPFVDSTFDLVYMHSVVQYFENLEYFEQVINEVHRVLKPGGSIFLIDVPNLNMKDLIDSLRPVSLKEKIYVMIPNFVRHIYTGMRNKNRSATQERFEIVGGIRITIPDFSGLYFEPEYFIDKWGDKFAQVDVHLQTYKSKPLTYRKFRFNVVGQSASK